MPDLADQPTTKHHPELYSAGRWGCWSACRCGRWSSRTYTTITGAHLAFGEHLLEVAELFHHPDEAKDH